MFDLYIFGYVITFVLLFAFQSKYGLANFIYALFYPLFIAVIILMVVSYLLFQKDFIKNNDEDSNTPT